MVNIKTQQGKSLDINERSGFLKNEFLQIRHQVLSVECEMNLDEGDIRRLDVGVETTYESHFCLLINIAIIKQKQRLIVRDIKKISMKV